MPIAASEINNTDLFRQTAETLGMAKALSSPQLKMYTPEGQLEEASGYVQTGGNTAIGSTIEEQEKAKEKKEAEQMRARADAFEDFSESMDVYFEGEADAYAGANWYDDMDRVAGDAWGEASAFIDDTWNSAEDTITKKFGELTESASATAGYVGDQLTAGYKAIVPEGVRGTITAGADAVVSAGASVLKTGEDALDAVSSTVSAGVSAVSNTVSSTVGAGVDAVDSGLKSAKTWLFGSDSLEGDKNNVVAAKKLKMSFEEASNPDAPQNDDEPNVAPAPTPKVPVAGYAFGA